MCCATSGAYPCLTVADRNCFRLCRCPGGTLQSPIRSLRWYEDTEKETKNAPLPMKYRYTKIQLAPQIFSLRLCACAPHIPNKKICQDSDGCDSHEATKDSKPTTSLSCSNQLLLERTGQASETHGDPHHLVNPTLPPPIPLEGPHRIVPMLRPSPLPSAEICLCLQGS